MTVKEYAKACGVSVQAVYQRIKGAKISLDSLKDGSTGELTEDGIKRLDGLFKRDLTQVEALQARIKELEADRDAWKKAAEQAQLLAAQAQALSLARLPAPRRSLLDVFRRKG